MRRGRGDFAILFVLPVRLLPRCNLIKGEISEGIVRG